MADLRRAPGLSAEDVTAAVRVHLDRVHDFARRLGCSPAAAVEVVETSAFDLVKAVATAPATVVDAVGWWFGRARAIGRRAAEDSSDLPVGGGLLSTDEDQPLLSEALELLPERDRVALLMRDSYALSAVSVGVALGTDSEGAMETVGRARLGFLAAVGDEDVMASAGHPVQLAALARLGEGGPVAAPDATARRHAQACTICRSLWDGENRAHLMLAGLTVVALPESLRESVLSRVDQQAKATLPAAADLLLLDADEVEAGTAGRWVGASYVLLAVLGAVVLGTVLGLLLSRSGSGGRSTSASAPPTAPATSAQPTTPLPLASPSALLSQTPTGQPSTHVFTIRPTPTPSQTPSSVRSTTASPEPATEPLALTANPASGPNGTPVTVTGTGWTPRGTVTLDYLDPLGRQTGSHASTTIDARGRFTTTLAAQDPANLPGRHRIAATDGTHTATATFTASG